MLRGILVIVLFLGSAAASAQFVEDFSDGVVSDRWCECQIDPRAPVTFKANPGRAGDFEALITVTEGMLGGNNCDRMECGVPIAAASLATGRAIPEAPDLPEPLGGSFFAPSEQRMLAIPPAPPPKYPGASPYCMAEEHPCIQRQELRLAGFSKPAEEAYDYTLRLRMPPAEQIGDRLNSIRWVIAQWKEKPLGSAYDDRPPEWGPSPFLALRFDDGVLHATVQDEECRCLVAAARHPLKELKGWIPDGRGGSGPPVENGRPTICESVSLGAVPQSQCLKLPELALEYGEEPYLSSPLGRWTVLRLRVQSGNNAEIRLEQDGRPIVKVKGRIGYEHVKHPAAPDEATKTQFKIGHYRDYMPFPATMEIDSIRIDEPSD